MAFTRLSFKKLWTSNKDFPTYEGSEAQVRADMQYHPDAVKEYINDTLIKELESSSGAAQIGDGQKGTVAKTLDDIYDNLAALGEDIKDLAGGETPESLRGVRLTFEKTDWAVGDDGSYYKIVYPFDVHKRTSNAFGYVISYESGGSYKKNTWATAGTDVRYSSDTKEITLRALQPYAGAVVFHGV